MNYSPLECCGCYNKLEIVDESNEVKDLLDKLEGILTERYFKRNYELGQKIFSPILENTPSTIKIPFINLLKKFKGCYINKNLSYDYTSIEVGKQILQLLDYKPKKIEWNGKKCALALTHDVDDLPGYKSVHEIAEIEKGLGLRSAWYFVPYSKQYKFNPEIVRKLTDDEFEVGLHGYTHDYAFASKSSETIKKLIKKSLTRLGLSNCGFRTPGLSRNIKLMKVLDSLNFLYDTTYPDFDIYSSGGVKTCFPYRFPGTDIYELPLTCPSDADLQNMGLNRDDALELTFERINMVKELSGVCVLLFHPRNMGGYNDYYMKLLSHIKNLGDTWVTTPNKIIEYVMN